MGEIEALQIRLSGFIRFLRQEGWNVGMAHSRDALNVCAHTLDQSPDVLQNALKITLCGCREDWNSFDDAFDRYWKTDLSEDNPPVALPPGRAATRKINKGMVGFSTSVDNEDAKSETPTMGGAGTSKGVGKTDFRFLIDRTAYLQAARLAERLAKQIRKRPSRRWKTLRKGNKLDARASLRDMARRADQGGRLLYKKRKTVHRRLIMVLDVSHSMSYYSPILSRFVRALTLTFPQSEAFCFHVEMHRVTDLLRQRKAEKVVESFESKQGLWFGGTKITESLRTLMTDYDHLLNARRTTVLFFSDGFDTMSAEDLTPCLQSLRRRVRRLYWIDPNLTRAQDAGLEEEGALHDAKQWIDDVFPGDSLQGLDKIIKTLASD